MSYDEGATVSMSSSEMHYDASTASQYSNALEHLTHVTSETLYAPPTQNSVRHSVEVSFGREESTDGDTRSKELANFSASTTETLSSEEKKGDVSPTSYIPNLVGENTFSNGLPPPPILLDTRIGSETSAFSSVSGVVHRPIASKPSPSSTPDNSLSASSSLLDSHKPQTRTPSPESPLEPISIKEAPKVVTPPVEPEPEPVPAPANKTGPQRRLQLFERASRLASRARRNKSASKGSQEATILPEPESLSQSPPRMSKNDRAIAIMMAQEEQISGSEEQTPSPPRSSKTSASSVERPPSPPPRISKVSASSVETPPSPPPPPPEPERCVSSSPSQATRITVTSQEQNPVEISVSSSSSPPPRSKPPTKSRPPPVLQDSSSELSTATAEIKELYARASPLARMRSDRAQEAVAMSPEAIAEAEAAAKAALVVQKDKKSEEQLVQETHRRWRRSLRNAKRKQRKHLDGDSVREDPMDPLANVACDTDGKLLSLLKLEFTDLIRTGCGAMEDVESQDGSSDDDSMLSDDSFYTDDDTSDRVRERGRSRTRRPVRGSSESPKRTKKEQVSRSFSADDKDISRDSTIESTIPSDGSDDDSEYDDSPDVDVSGSPRSKRRGSLDQEGPGSPRASNSKSLRSDRSKSKNSPVKKGDVGITDKNFIRAFIQEASQDGLSFIWHKEAKTSKSVSQSLNVDLYLKLGHVEQDGRYSGPSLVWDVHGEDASSEDGSIDLFDIQSVEKSSAVQMQNYPFALPGNSFFVRTTDGKDYAFEASSDEEARRFIHGLRWLVARLAFNLIIGNRDVSCELVTLLGDDPSPRNSGEEMKHSRAMNDVTHHLVEKIVFHTMEM